MPPPNINFMLLFDEVDLPNGKYPKNIYDARVIDHMQLSWISYLVI